MQMDREMVYLVHSLFPLQCCNKPVSKLARQADKGERFPEKRKAALLGQWYTMPVPHFVVVNYSVSFLVVCSWCKLNYVQIIFIAPQGSGKPQKRGKRRKIKGDEGNNFTEYYNRGKIRKKFPWHCTQMLHAYLRIWGIKMRT